MPVLMVCNLQRGRQRQCHERRMGHHAGAGLRCSESHRDTQDRTNIKNGEAFTVSIADAAPHSGSRLFRRRVRAIKSPINLPQRSDRQQSRNCRCPCHQRVPNLPGVQVHRVSEQCIRMRASSAKADQCHCR